MAAEDDDGKPFLPRWLLYAMLPGIAAPVAIFVFIVVTESAHDTQSCPYEEATERELADGSRVVEERRRCLPDVEERRFTLWRGETMQVLGERRFEPGAFASDRYRFRVELSDQGEVQVFVENDGHADVMFREGTAAEHDSGIPRRKR